MRTRTPITTDTERRDKPRGAVRCAETSRGELTTEATGREHWRSELHALGAAPCLCLSPLLFFFFSIHFNPTSTLAAIGPFAALDAAPQYGLIVRR